MKLSRAKSAHNANGKNPSATSSNSLRKLFVASAIAIAVSSPFFSKLARADGPAGKTIKPKPPVSDSAGPSGHLQNPSAPAGDAQVIPYIKKYAADISIPDWSKDAKVLCVGEFHTENASKKLFADSIPGLSEKGFNYLMLESVNMDTQGILDKYFELYSQYNQALDPGKSTKKIGEEIKKLELKIKRKMSEFPCYRERLKDDFEIVKAAVSNGIKVIAVSRKNAILTYYTPDGKSKLISETALEILDSDENARVIFYGGTLHAYNQGIPRFISEMSQNNFPMLSVVILGVEPENPGTESEHIQTIAKIEKAIGDSELADKSFAFPLIPEIGQDYPFSDYIIYLPITEEVTNFPFCL